MRSCLVGRFLTRRPIHTAIMKGRLSTIWQPGRGVAIRVLDSSLFLFQFFRWRDVNKVYAGGPWHFDGHLLILSMLGVGMFRLRSHCFMLPFGCRIMTLQLVLSLMRKRDLKSGANPTSIKVTSYFRRFKVG